MSCFKKMLKWWLRVIPSNYLYLYFIITESQYSFIFLLAFCISSFVNWLLIPFVLFFFFLLSNYLLETCPCLVYPGFLSNLPFIFPWNIIRPHPHPQFQPPSYNSYFCKKNTFNFQKWHLKESISFWFVRIRI